MNQNYGEHLQNIYRNILMHQQTMAYANMMVAFTPTPPPSIKLEPVETPAATIATLPTLSSPAQPEASSALSTSFSLDTEIPRDEIEGDIEVIMVRHFHDNLKKLDTTLNGLRGKKFGFRELLEMSQTRPTYVSTGNSATKRNRTSSFGSTIGSSSIEEDPRSAKKAKANTTDGTNHHNDSCSSDEGRLMIDWTETEHEQSTKTVEIKSEKVENSVIKKSTIDGDEYKPSKLRFERLKTIQKKKPRFNVDNLDLTYHSNMARNFPGTENRTEEQQERRNKNTLAARISRNKNKAYEKILEQQSMDATVENINLKRQVACLRVYANSLMKLSGFADTDFSKMWESNIKELMFAHDEN